MTYDDMKAPTWQSPTGSWKTYAAITDDHARQHALDHLNAALARLQYVQGWATLDGAEADSLNGAILDIRAALKEFSR